MSHTTDFSSAPHQFANLHCLYPYADPVTNGAHMKDLVLNDGTHFTEVRGDNKVAWCKIKRAVDVDPLPSDDSPRMSYSGDRNLWVLRVRYDSSSGAVPCYYLPWRSDHMIRMKLKPSPNHPATTGLRRTTVQPDLFVTAALQGCSVIVSGTPDEPVVSHVNASSVTGPAGEKFGRDDAQHDIAAASKAQHMMGLHQAARTQFRKEGQKAGGLYPDPALTPNLTTGAVHGMDYMSGMRPSFTDALKRMYWQRVQGRAQPRRDGTPQLDFAQYGTVFGVRTGGQWAFYRQTRNRIGYLPRGTDRFVYEWMDPVCVRFWP